MEPDEQKQKQRVEFFSTDLAFIDFVCRNITFNEDLNHINQAKFSFVTSASDLNDQSLHLDLLFHKRTCFGLKNCNSFLNHFCHVSNKMNETPKLIFKC